MNREMVSVILFDDGTYEIKDIDKIYATQRLCGWQNGRYVEIYHCPKDKWRKYLLKLLSENDVDKEIAELEKRKKRLAELKNRIIEELKTEELKSRQKVRNKE